MAREAIWRLLRCHCRAAAAAGITSLCLVTSVLPAAAQSRGVEDTPFAPSAAAEAGWPGGGSANWHHRQVLIGRTAAERLRRYPESPNTVGWLWHAGRLDDALTVLERVVERHPDRLVEALETVDVWRIRADRARGYQNRASAIVAAAERTLASLEREDAARVAFALIPLEQAAAQSPERIETVYQRFVDAFAGTETAQLAEVDLVTYLPQIEDKLAAYERIAAAAPDTVVAAKARHSKAFQLGRNWLGDVQRHARNDPAEAFGEMLAIVADLESGRYPPCTWVDNAAELVTGYSLPTSLLSSESALRLLDGIQRFITTHPSLLTSTHPGRSVDGLVSSVMPRVAAFLPDGVAELERRFAAFEREWPDPAAAKLVRASWLGARQESFIGPVALPPASETRGAEITTLLASAAASTNQAFARRGLAQLAERELADPAALGSAHAHYLEYARRFPAADDVWAARLRAGQVEALQGKHRHAAESFLKVADAHASDAFVRTLALAYAGRSSEEVDAFADASAHYRAALDAWPTELGTEVSLDLPRERGRESWRPGDVPPQNPALVQKVVLERRAAEIGRALEVLGGTDLEVGRRLLSANRLPEALAALEAVAGRYPDQPTGAEARLLLKRARLQAAVARVAVPRAEGATAAALTELDVLAREPFDAVGGAAGVVAATVRFLEGQREDADQQLMAVLQRWAAEGADTREDPAPGSLESDVLAIRDAVFRPLGHAALNPPHALWNAFQWPTQLPRFIVAQHALRVKVAESPERSVDVARHPPGLSNVIFLTSDDIAFLTGTVARVGGTERREPTAIMELPNQPIGGARAIVEWWNRFFPARPGHWFGSEILTYPAFSSVEFLDRARTRALVPITVGYSGATVVLEKSNGVWTIKELVNVWVT